MVADGAGSLRDVRRGFAASAVRRNRVQVLSYLPGRIGERTLARSHGRIKEVVRAAPREKNRRESRESVDFPKMALGGAGIANLYRAVSAEDAEATIHAALRRGFGLIDTAPFYGHGLSETRIGRALAHWSGPRPLVSSKVGRVLEAVPPGSEGDFGFVEPLPYRPRFDYSRDGVRRSLEGSLERLGIDKLDIALVHDIGAQVHGAAHGERMREFFDETLPALNDARTEGLV